MQYQWWLNPFTCLGVCGWLEKLTHLTITEFNFVQVVLLFGLVLCYLSRKAMIQGVFDWVVLGSPQYYVVISGLGGVSTFKCLLDAETRHLVGVWLHYGSFQSATGFCYAEFLCFVCASHSLGQLWLFCVGILLYRCGRLSFLAMCGSLACKGVIRVSCGVGLLACGVEVVAKGISVWLLIGFHFVEGWVVVCEGVAFCPLLRCILMYVITRITVFFTFSVLFFAHLCLA